jgi:diguanylate cyclase (GGDEF)-like protein
MQDIQTTSELRERIAELEHTVKLLKEDLIHDSLTGIKTRTFFNYEAKKHFNAIVNDSGAQRRGWFEFKTMSFIFFDIDHFKKVNDKYGHMTGDEVLKVVAHTIEAGVRDEDVVCRWGGEEIVVALLGADEKQAKKKTEEIRKSIERLAFNEDDGFKVTISSGVASTEAGVSFEDTIDRADKCLYKAKKTGRNKVVVYSEIEK